jgi:hypothetical protein
MMKRLIFAAIVAMLTVVSPSLAIQPAAAVPTHRALEMTSAPQASRQANTCATGTKGMLTAVAASSTRDAWAAGFDFEKNKLLLEHWDGTCWRLVPSTAIRGSISDIAAISPHDAWAVGTTSMGGPTGKTLIARWDGVSWKVVPSPSTRSSGILSGVAAVSAHDVWVAGWDMNETDTTSHGLLAHWDGSGWRVAPSSVAGVGTLRLAAISARDVWAVGSTTTGSGNTTKIVTLAQHWDGRLWQIVHSPSLVADENLLVAVAAASARDVWAAGWAEIKGKGLPLMLHWDGTRWSKAAVADPKSIVTGLAAISAHDVWSAGSVMQHWDGNRWSTIPLAAPAQKILGVGATDVAAISARDVWAVGAVAVSRQEARTLVERWDGARWHVVPS